MQIIDLPTKLWIGNDALTGLQNLPYQKVFVVTDPFIIKSDMLRFVTDNLVGKDVAVFSDIVPDPPVATVVQGIEAMKAFQPDVLVAIGGGSSIDAAKAMYFFGKESKSIDPHDFVAIPTTSGTGSEVTNFSVITVPESGVKYPLVTSKIQPSIAILDTRLVMSVPPAITADTGMDVICHLLESYVSTNQNIMADILVEYAIKLAFENLPLAYKDGSNVEARGNMHLASCLAGMAFNLTNLGINHGIAHSVGAKLHIPHGRINAILLPIVVAYNACLDNGAKSQIIKGNDSATKRYARLARICGFTSSSNPQIGAKALVRKLSQLRDTLKIPSGLVAAGYERNVVLDAFDSIADAALVDGCTATNPRIPTKDDVLRLLNEIL